MALHLPSIRNKLDITRKNRWDNLGWLLDDFFTDFPNLVPASVLKNFDSGFIPKIDISEKDSSYFVEAELPGVKQDDIDVKIDNGILTIKGKKESEREDKDKNYYSRERFYGEFQRSISLPSNIDEDKVEANFKDGVLNLKIPMKNAKEVKKISIKK